MSDYLVKSLACDGHLRAYAIDATETIREAQKRQDTWSAASAALGRSMIGTLLLATSSLKGDEKMTVKINGNGPVGGIVIDGNSKGTVKGYVQNPHVHLPLNDKGKIDVKGAVGTEGFLAVTKDYGLKEPFTGQVPLVSGEIAEDITQYFVQSEQIPTACALGVLIDTDQSVRAAGGYLIQLLPGAGEDVITKVEGGIYAAPSVTNILKENPDPAAMLKTVLSDFDMEILSVDPIEYRCYCSRERTERALLSLGSKDLEQIVEEQGGAELSCQFCDKVQTFTADELRAMIADLKARGK